jgi:hypothetical protein
MRLVGLLLGEEGVYKRGLRCDWWPERTLFVAERLDFFFL